MKLYGIRNCGTVRKASEWLASRGIGFEFHDLRKLGLDAATAGVWLKQMHWTELVNRRGLTWRGLPEQLREGIRDNESALQLMVEQTSVIKRPVLVSDGTLLCVGFDEPAYCKLFNVESWYR